MSGIWALVITLILIVIGYIDRKTMTIPDRLNLVLACATAVGLCFYRGEETLFSRVAGIFIVSAPMLLMTLAIPECFGGGDIKLAAVCGFMLGWRRMVLAAFLSVLTGGCFAFWLIITGKARQNPHFAFGPFLAFGVCTALYYGYDLMVRYFNFF